MKKKLIVIGVIVCILAIGLIFAIRFKTGPNQLGSKTFVSELTYEKTGYGFDQGSKGVGISLPLLGADSAIYPVYINGSAVNVKINLGDGSTSLMCAKEDCTHQSASGCESYTAMNYMNFDDQKIYYSIGNGASKEILTYSKEDGYAMLSKLDREIYEMWLYQDYLYISTNFGIDAVCIGEHASGEDLIHISDQHIFYTCANFRDHYMYFVDEVYRLWRLDLKDHSESIIYEDKAVFAPQIMGDRLYLRVLAVGENRAKACIISLDLDGKDERLEVDEEIWRYFVREEETEQGKNEWIYYTNTPQEKLFEGDLFCGFGTDIKRKNVASGEIEVVLEDTNGELYSLFDSGWIITEKSTGKCAEHFHEQYPDYDEVTESWSYLYNTVTKEGHWIDPTELAPWLLTEE